MHDKLIPIKPDEKSFPTNLKPGREEEMIRVPIIEKFKEVDGELYYQIRGDQTLRKWSEYNHMNFN